MRCVIELEQNFWRIDVGGRVQLFSDLDRAMEILKREIVREVGKCSEILRRKLRSP